MPASLPRATRSQLLQMARDAAARAHCPYSGFHVGAAVLAGGRFFRGANIENASFGLTICAERAAIFAAVGGGQNSLRALAVTCPDALPGSPPENRMPCGSCRQVIAEFAPPDTLILIDGVGDMTVAELLPAPFRLSAARPPADPTPPEKPRLCIDIDNVIARTDVVIRGLIREATNGKVNLAYEDVRDFDYRKCIDAAGNQPTREDWDEAHDRRFSSPGCIAAVEPVPGAADCLRRLEEVFSLHYVTGRRPSARAATADWLARHGFPGGGLHFLPGREKHLSLGRFFAAVEDDPAQAEAFALAGVHSYLMAHPWNEVGGDALTHRYEDWGPLTEGLLRAAGE